MCWEDHKYTDSSGNQWSVRLGSLSGTRRSIAFTSKGHRLIAEGVDAETSGELTVTRLKELFCDADRVLENCGVSWHVGYRRRLGMSEHTTPGMNTWFTSDRGEVRYVQGMLPFRHLDELVLREYLLTAIPVSGRARVWWRRGE